MLHILDGFRCIGCPSTRLLRHLRDRFAEMVHDSPLLLGQNFRCAIRHAASPYEIPELVRNVVIALALTTGDGIESKRLDVTDKPTVR